MHDHRSEVQADLQHVENLIESAERVLLLNPPVHDTRVPWSQFQQPVLLLKLATLLGHHNKDVKLIDARYVTRGKRVTRERVAILDLDGIPLNKWRFGLSRPALRRALRALAIDDWRPDQIYVECLTPFWWEGAAEAIGVAKAQFPDACLILVGPYASLAPEHAARHTEADKILSGTWSALAALQVDVSLYPEPPAFAYLTLGAGQLPPTDVVDAIASNISSSKRRLQSFAFVEPVCEPQFVDQFRAVLEEIIARKLDVTLYALGSVSPPDFLNHPNLAGLMKQAGYAQITFADDRDVGLDSDSREHWIDACRSAAAACRDAGFKMRTEAVTASLCLGRRDESLAERVRTCTLLAHFVGSVIIWPYQPTVQECDNIPLEEQNGKLFPLRTQNGTTYRDYLEIQGLTTVLNAKYRDTTFDFLGDGLISRLFRESVVREAWDPDPMVKGSLHLPLVQR